LGAPVSRKQRFKSLPAALVLLVLPAVAGCRDPRPAAEPEPHHTEAHLQKVLAWTAAERQAASQAAKKVQEDLNVAIKAGQRSFRIPPGDYTDWQPPGVSGHRAILVVDGAKNMEIDATGATFWKSLAPGSAVIFTDCRDCTVRGVTADMLQSPFVQGLVTEVVPNGHEPGWDKILLDLEDGFFPVEQLRAQTTSGRNWRMRPDGSVKGYISKLNLLLDEKHSPGQWALRQRADATADEAVAPGDRVSFGVKTGSGGVVVNQCENMKFEDLTVFSSGVFAVWEKGIRAPGGNTFTRMKIIPRPGSTRIGVSAMDGFHSYNQHKGPTLIDCEIARTHDDGINIHGFVNVVLQKLPENRYVLASIHGRDYDVGTELTLNRAPAMESLGTARVAAWEPFDQAEGMRLYAEMQMRYMAEFNTTIRKVIVPEFHIVSFDRPVGIDALDMATSHEYCGRGTRITNLYVHTGCNRGVLIRGPDSVIENSRFQDITFGGLALTTALNNYLEGGFLSNVKVLNNTFENCGDSVFGHPFADGVIWNYWGSITLAPSLPPFYQEAFLHLNPNIVYRDVEIAGNRINNTRGLPIFIANTKGVTVRDNIITKPFQAPPEALKFLDLTRRNVIERKFAPPVPESLTPLLKEPFYAIFVSASEDVILTGNRVEDAPPHFKGLLGIGPWCKDIKGQP